MNDMLLSVDSAWLCAAELDVEREEMERLEALTRRQRGQIRGKYELESTRAQLDLELKNFQLERTKKAAQMHRECSLALRENHGNRNQLASSPAAATTSTAGPFSSNSNSNSGAVSKQKKQEEAFSNQSFQTKKREKSKRTPNASDASYFRKSADDGKSSAAGERARDDVAAAMPLASGHSFSSPSPAAAATTTSGGAFVKRMQFVMIEWYYHANGTNQLVTAAHFKALPGYEKLSHSTVSRWVASEAKIRELVDTGRADVVRVNPLRCTTRNLRMCS